MAGEHRARLSRASRLPLAALVAEERQRQRLSLNDVATRVRRAARAEGQTSDASKTTVSRWEQGELPRVDSLRWLATALDVPLKRAVGAAQAQKAETAKDRTQSLVSQSAAETPEPEGPPAPGAPVRTASDAARPEAFLPVALEAMTAAVEEFGSARPASVRVESKGDRDLVTSVDLRVERRLREFLGLRTPEIAFLGEEEGLSRPSGELSWVLDPIDGTVNFVRGLPTCAVALALVDRGRPVLGVIDLPFLGLRYSAVVGQGAHLNGVRLAVRQTRELSEAVVAFGDYAVGPGSESRNRVPLEVASRLASVALRVRMLGSAAIDLAWLAEGRLDASIEFSSRPWDVAAGIVVAREAGARVVDLYGADHDLRSTALLAAPSTLIDQVVDLVRRAGDLPT